MSLFGNTNSFMNNNSFGAFNQPQQNTSLFGQSASLFGNNNQSNNSMFTPNKPNNTLGGGGLFNNQNSFNNNNNVGSIFGGNTNMNQNNNAGSLFGGNTNTLNNTSNSLFGGGNTMMNNNTNNTGGLFGGNQMNNTMNNMNNMNNTMNTSGGINNGMNSNIQSNGTFNFPYQMTRISDSKETMNVVSITSNDTFKLYSQEELRLIDLQLKKSGRQPMQGGMMNNTNTIFGGNTMQNNNTGGLFGGNTNTQSIGGGLFQSNTNNTNTGGLFGGNNNSGSLFGQNNNNSGGLFGQNNNTTQNTSLFGGNNNTSGGLFNQNNNAFNNNNKGLFNNPVNTNTGGLFGNNMNNNNNGGGLFGGNNNPMNTGNSLFGGNQNNNNNNSLFNNPAQQQGGLFGNQPAQNTNQGGLFGNATQPNNGNSLFGGNTGSSLFGNTNNTNTNNGGGLFGGTTNSNSANTGGLFGATNNTNTGGGLFGSTNNNNTGGGLFGNNNTNNNNTSGGLFGSKPANQQTGGGLFGNTNTNTGGGLFGSSTTTNNTGGGLFGNTTTTNTTSGGLFGSSASTNNTTGGGLFSNTNSNSLFGNSTTNNKPASGGLFGSSTTNTGSLFGNTTTNKPTGGLFGSSTNTGSSLFGNTSANGTTNGGLFSNTVNGASNPTNQNQQNMPQGGNYFQVSNSVIDAIKTQKSIQNFLNELESKYEEDNNKCLNNYGNFLSKQFLLENELSRSGNYYRTPSMMYKSKPKFHKMMRVYARSLLDGITESKINIPSFMKSNTNQSLLSTSMSKRTLSQRDGAKSNLVFQDNLVSIEEKYRKNLTLRSEPSFSYIKDEHLPPENVINNEIYQREKALKENKDINLKEKQTSPVFQCLTIHVVNINEKKSKRIKDIDIMIDFVSVNKTSTVLDLKEAIKERVYTRLSKQTTRDFEIKSVTLMLPSGPLEDSKTLLEYDTPLSLTNISCPIECYIGISSSNKDEEPKKRKLSITANTDRVAPDELVPKLTKEGYHTSPDYVLLCRMSSEELRNVKDLRIYNKYGEVHFTDKVNLLGMNIDEEISIEERCIEIKETKKGKGLNVSREIKLNGMLVSNGMNNDSQIVEKKKEMIKDKIEELGGIFQDLDVENGILRFKVIVS